jgi:PIN domain nuclease of toxin-antitoxin system
MKFLLDTHTFLWFISGDNLLSKRAKDAIESAESHSYLSIASLWEIGIKTRLNKLNIGMPFKDLKKQIDKNGFEILPVLFSHIEIISELPVHHQDPFDRLLIAQCKTGQLTLITKDEKIKPYNIQTLW